jgi:hypothetical protein
VNRNCLVGWWCKKEWVRVDALCCDTLEYGIFCEDPSLHVDCSDLDSV